MVSDSIAVVSGGMDSVTMLHYAVKRLKFSPTVLLFDYHQRPVKELESARWQSEQLGLEHVTVELPIREYEEGDINNYVPSRNIVFLSIAASLAEERGLANVFCGFQEDDRVWDCVQAFLDKMNTVMELNDRFKLRFSAPLVTYSKTRTVRLGLELGINYAQTWSCFSGEERPCGKCKTCKDRIQAFVDAGSTDPLVYLPH